MPFVEHDGVRIHYRDGGNPEGEPLLLLHWFMGSMETFHNTSYARLFRSHFRLILMDHRGYGQSSKPHNPLAYDPVNHVNDIIHLLNHLQIDRVHTFGYSMGGRINFAIMQHAPERLIRCTIGGMHPYRDIPTDLQKRAELLKKGIKDLIDAYDIVQPRIREQMLKNDHKALLADTIQTMRWEGYENEIKTFDQPVLLFVGEKDNFLPGVRKVSNVLPRAHLVVLPGHTHRSALLDKRMLVPHLRRFFGRNF